MQPKVDKSNPQHVLLARDLMAILDNREALDAYKDGFGRGFGNRPVESKRREDQNYVMGYRAGCVLRDANADPSGESKRFK